MYDSAQADSLSHDDLAPIPCCNRFLEKHSADSGHSIESHNVRSIWFEVERWYNSGTAATVYGQFYTSKYQ